MQPETPTNMQPQPGEAASASANHTSDMPTPPPPPMMAPQESPDKDYVTAALLSGFLGNFGIDRFYLGYVVTGILKLVTFGGAGIWAAIDFLLIIFGGLKDKNGLPLKGYAAHHKGAKIFGWIYIASIGLFLILPLLFIILAAPSLQSHARDTGNQNNLATMAGGLDEYKNDHGTYPTIGQFSTSSIGITAENGNLKLDVVYKPAPANCNAASVPCTGFTLSYTDTSSHKVYTVTN